MSYALINTSSTAQVKRVRRGQLAQQGIRVNYRDDIERKKDIPKLVEELTDGADSKYYGLFFLERVLAQLQSC